MKISSSIILFLCSLTLGACGQEAENGQEPDATGAGAQLAEAGCTAEKFSGLTSPSKFSWKLNEQIGTIEIIGGSSEPGMMLAWAIALKLYRPDPTANWQLVDGDNIAGTLFCTGNAPAACLADGAVFTFTVGQLNESGRCSTGS